jgi:hypothetical protein
MRLSWIGLPAGLALASAGLLLYTQAQKPHYDGGEIIQPQPKHPVTSDMTRATAAKARKKAPPFIATDVAQKKVYIAQEGSEKPQFLYFVLDGCPCSFDAEPLFQDLYEHLGRRVEFISVTDAEFNKAKRWWHQMTVPYSVVSGSDLTLMKAYEAKNSVYSALISKDGKIVKMWPGYSIDILTEMNQLMSVEAGIPIKPFDTKYAPKERSSGCPFKIG